MYPREAVVAPSVDASEYLGEAFERRPACNAVASPGCKSTIHTIIALWHFLCDPSECITLSGLEIAPVDRAYALRRPALVACILRKGKQMLAELSFITVNGKSSHMSEEVAEAVRIIDESGLPYQLTPTATCIEGSWEAVMSVVGRCRERLLERSPHLITMLKLEDEIGSPDKLHGNVESVAVKAGIGVV
ncbi:MAG: hypothetical protein GF344_01650 [Chitinivibrionales bacterium]|nr:hypothetical protein [Chitinivibrionales bacterium]MBD3355795.1 hypothetical protein [Chitinivibrionales bacterium]